MRANYSLQDEQEVREAEVEDLASLERLLREVARHPTAHGLIPAVELIREDEESLVLAQTDPEHFLLLWCDPDGNSWSTGDNSRQGDDLVPFEYFGAYTEAYKNQFLPRGAVLGAVSRFFQGAQRESSGLELHRD